MEDHRTDAELLRELHDGEPDAFVVLWERHIGSALIYARRLFPSRAEDLASESFLAIYEQVTRGHSPILSFRPYLKGVMRHTAIRWYNESNRLVDTAEPDSVDFRDALSLVEREAAARELLGAFQDLPPRWQQVLWLSEVADVGRADIARELGIRPNAVSALHRRARSGFKLQWLSRQVPVSLRDDDSHAARLFPRYLTTPDADISNEVTAHLETCDPCGELLVTLQTDSRRLQGVTLSAVGFGALGVILPTTSAVAPPAAVAAVAVASGAGVGLASLLFGGLGILTIGGVLLGSFLLKSEPVPVSSQVSSSVVKTSPAPAPQPTQVTGGAPVPVATPPGVAPEPRLGRRNDDPSVGSVDLVADPAAFPDYHDRPRPADTPVPDPGDDPTTPLTPGVSTPATYTGYFPPAIEGTTSPGSTVAIALNGSRYTRSAGDDGSWSFDPRGLDLPAGTYDYQVWAYDDTVQSAATDGVFTLEPLTIRGFEDITGFEDMQVAEASTTGLVIALTGPPNGTVWVSSMTGHTAFIPLDETGQTVKRLRMNSRGWYWLTFRALDADGFWGPMEERGLDVYDPDIIFDPWGPNPEEMTFDFVDP